MRRPPNKQWFLALLLVALLGGLGFRVWTQSHPPGQPGASASPQVLQRRWTPADLQASQKRQKLNPDLVKAVEADDVKKARELLEQGASPELTNDVCMPLLNFAAHFDEQSMAELLLEKGANIHLTVESNKQ